MVYRTSSSRVRDAESSPGVLIVGNFISEWGGSSRGACEELAGRLADAGGQVLTTSSQRHPIRRLGDMLMTVWKKRHEYDVAQVDVFSGRAFVWAEAVSWVLRKAGKPFVLTLHGGTLPEFTERWPIRVERLLRSATFVTAPSRYLQERLRFVRADIELIPNGMNLSAYRWRVRSELRPKILWIRAFDEIYNPTLMPKVLSMLVETHPDAELTMIGPDKRDGSLERTQVVTKALGLESKVEFILGVPKAEVPGWLGRHDIFLSLPDADNAPVSVVEAMASGLPVVSSDVGGIGYLLKHGEDALLVPPRDQAAATNAVEMLLGDPGLAKRLATRAREKAGLCDWCSVLPKWQNLFQRSISGGRDVAV